MSTEEHIARGRVAVGVDGSPESEAAIRYAVTEAKRRNAGLRLIHVLPTFPGGLAISVLDSAASTPTGRALMRRAIRIARAEDADVPIETRLVAGDRCGAIVDAGRDADEIVLGHDPAPTLLRLATGSTVVGVAARAAVAVIAVSRSQETRQEALGHRTIIVGIKHPNNARALVQRGFELAAERGAAVRFIYAWELPPGYEALAATSEERAELSRTAALEIRQPLTQLVKSYPDIACEIAVVHGNPARVLEEASRTADLLVLARRAHTFPRGYIGGVARAILHHAACPVMFVPPGLAARQSAASTPEAENQDPDLQPTPDLDPEPSFGPITTP